MFTLPEEIVKATGGDPTSLVIIGLPKMGKGTILGALTREKNALIFDLERGGYDYIDARKVSVYPTSQTSLLEAFHNYTSWRDALLKEKGKYKYLIIDVLTELDKFAEIGGTYHYMYNVPMGKNFNRDKQTGQAYEYGNPNFRLVTTLPEGNGYAHTRKWFLDQIEIFEQISPYRIYAAHIADKYVKENQKEEVVGAEIALTGQLKRLFAAKVTTLAKLVADGKKRYLSFDVANDSIIAGSRAPHLKGQVLISEENEDGEIVTYWNNIYKEQ